MGSVLITGGAGSLGVELALLLVKDGHNIRVFDLPGLDYSPFENVSRVEVVCGNITDPATIKDAASGVDSVIHLAALLPPVSEGDWEKTEAVNVAGTGNLLKAVREDNGEAHFIFSSSVATYGDTTAEGEPLDAGREQRPNDFYSRSKVESEQLVVESGLPYTVLRISGIAIPAFLEPPAIWPFMHDQRMEFVCRNDVITALFNCVGNREAMNRVFNIAGGPTWQIRGHQYVKALFDLMGVLPEEAHYMDRPGWFDWYRTDDSQAVLDYQQTDFPGFISRVEQAVKELLG